MARVRPLTPEDSILELTALIHRAYARLGAMGLNFTAVDQTPEVTAQRVSEGQCFVAEVDGRVVGTVVVRMRDATSEAAHFRRHDLAIVNQFAVEPALQGNGIGRSLLARCEEWAVERGLQEIALDTSEQAEHLTRLYRRMGYTQVEVVQWPGKVYRSVVLSKSLAPMK